MYKHNNRSSLLNIKGKLNLIINKHKGIMHKRGIMELLGLHQINDYDISKR